MKFVLNISGVPGDFKVADVHGGEQGEIVKWKVENKTLVDIENLTFAPKPGFPYPFKLGSETILKKLKSKHKKEMQAEILPFFELDDGSYKFNLVADSGATVIGADPDIEVALDLGLSKKRKKKRVGLTPGKSRQLKSRKPAVKKGTKKPAKPSKGKKTAKRK